MPIRLITGLPGNGKTLYMVSDLQEQAMLAERPLYQCGIDGLKPGLAERIDNARDWNAVDPTKAGECTCGKREPHAHVVPDGALIYVDEAWKWFGHLHDARGQQTPLSVLDLAEHRHRGIDFVWTSQAPSQIYPFARTLIAEHSHIVRRFGTHMCTIYTWSELNDDVKSKVMRDQSLSRNWKFPANLFDVYKSATKHTIKRKIPWRLWLIPIALVVAVCCVFAARKALDPSTVAASVHKGPNAAQASAPLDQGDDSSSGHVHYRNASDYLKAHTPRIANMPWSAPIYDDRKPTTDPRIFCAIDGESHSPKATCHCYTEQATRLYGITFAECWRIAAEGIYDPYLQVTTQASRSASSGQRQQPGSMQPVVSPLAGLAVKAGQQQDQGTPFGHVDHYGQMHTDSPADDSGYQADHF